MQVKLTRIAPFQAGKVLAALYGAMSLILVPFMLLFMAMGSFAARAQGGAGAPALPLMFGMGVGFMLLLPIFYAAMGFVFGVISAAVYNFLAKSVGGFEFDFENLAPPAAPPAPPPLA